MFWSPRILTVGIFWVPRARNKLYTSLESPKTQKLNQHMKFGATWSKKPADWFSWKQFLAHSQGRGSLLGAATPFVMEKLNSHFQAFHMVYIAFFHNSGCFWEKCKKTSRVYSKKHDRADIQWLQCNTLSLYTYICCVSVAFEFVLNLYFYVSSLKDND